MANYHFSFFFFFRKIAFFLGFIAPTKVPVRLALRRRSVLGVGMRLGGQEQDDSWWSESLTDVICWKDARRPCWQ